MIFNKDYFFPFHLWSIIWLILFWAIFMFGCIWIYKRILDFKQKIKDDSLKDLEDLENKLARGEITKIEFYKEKQKLKL